MDRSIDRRRRSPGKGQLSPGGVKIALPQGVSRAQWALERRTVQNPRIRSLLGCVRGLESVLDSNYAILHCSPYRLHEVWRRARRISGLMRTELAPLFEEPSCIPDLETERQNTVMALEILESTVLRDLDQFPVELESGHLTQVRKLLCVSMGKLHAFLQDALARIVASDPRSRFDADYFLSRRFPRDIEEAEWLWASVAELRRYLESLRDEREVLLTTLAEQIEIYEKELSDDLWRDLLAFLDLVKTDLASRLREVLSLRGIRFDEMEVLDRYATELPMLATLIHELGGHSRDLNRELASLPELHPEFGEQSLAARIVVQKAANKRLSALLISLDERLRDLEAFVPFWREEISRRRALMLRSPEDPSERLFAAETEKNRASDPR